uniref:Uncharacterized protein n=1 Tax=Sus scrofa TaxID=9823 RepID=A0A8D1DA33_PIG
FPVSLPDHFIKDSLSRNYLQEGRHKLRFCKKQMIKTLKSVVRKEQTKNLKVPRYHLILKVHRGQKNNQRLLIAGRCIWNPGIENFNIYYFRNSNLFAFSRVYHVFLE